MNFCIFANSCWSRFCGLFIWRSPSFCSFLGWLTYSLAPGILARNSLAGLGIAVLGNVIVRLLYELLMLFVLICRNVADINRKLGSGTNSRTRPQPPVQMPVPPQPRQTPPQNQPAPAQAQAPQAQASRFSSKCPCSQQNSRPGSRACISHRCRTPRLLPIPRWFSAGTAANNFHADQGGPAPYCGTERRQ